MGKLKIVEFDGLDSKNDGDEWVAECPRCDKLYVPYRAAHRLYDETI
jgi:uncharacterized C2H2 Zn-finger protein